MRLVLLFVQSVGQCPARDGCKVFMACWSEETKREPENGRDYGGCMLGQPSIVCRRRRRRRRRRLSSFSPGLADLTASKRGVCTR